VFRPIEAECFSRPKSERQVKHAASAACVARRMTKYILVLDVRHVKILDRKNAVLDNFNLLSIKLMI
jgi:hypothetical protein